MNRTASFEGATAARSTSRFRLRHPLCFALAAPLLLACAVQPTDGEDSADATERPETASGEEANLGTSQSAVTYFRSYNLTFVEDFTGDGVGDWMTVAPDNTFFVENSSTDAETVWVKHGGSPLNDDQINFIDFNGDKKMDMIVQGYDNRFWVSISTGTTFKPPANWLTHGGTYHEGQAQYVDVTGDGKADVVFQGLDNHFWVSVTTSAGFKPPANWVTHGGTFVAGKAQYGDVNGDGKADLVFLGGGNQFWVSTSTGSGFTAPKSWLTGPAGNLYHSVVRVNADARADLRFVDGAGKYWVAYSTGTGFNAPVRCELRYPWGPFTTTLPRCG